MNQKNTVKVPGFPASVKVYDRKDLDLVQREIREIEGVTILIYEQVCAVEKRRRRKRGINCGSSTKDLHQ